MRHSEQGFTLIEVIVAFAVFAIVVVGALTVVGAAQTGGFLDTFPTAFGGGRTGKDYTAASVYLQGFHEHLASRGSTNLGLSSSCPQVFPFAPGGANPFGFPPPSSGLGFQLDWTQLQVRFELWHWNGASKYESCMGSPPVPDDLIVRVVSTLTWDFKNSPRQVVVDRFLPRTPGGTND